MSTRQRMTWAALEREAAAPPAIPGYGVEDQEHPAHTQDDPGQDDYNIGGPSEFAEDVHPPPYGDSGPPAIPGYGVEDQDHPAHSGQVGRQAGLMDLVRRKSAKALVLAKATLGKTAAWGDIENQAFGYMSMDDSALDDSLGRLGGDFLGMEEELMEMFPEDEGMDEVMGEDPMEEGMGEDPMEARLLAMETEINSMRAAAQNDPAGETLGASGKSEDEEKKEEAAANKEASSPFMAMFDAFDTDSDGFVAAEEWGGPREMFASLDTDGDGIIARHEVLAGCEKLPEGGMRDNCEAKKDKGGDDDDKGDDDKDDKKASDDEDDDGDEKEAKKAFGHFADFDDDELEMLQAMEFAPDDGDEDMGDALSGCDVMASDKEAKKGDDDEGDDADDDEGSDKEASEAEFFATGFDPMGLSDGTSLTAADKAAFSEVFGSDDGDDDDDEGGDDEGSDKEATLDAILQPQAKKASSGVKSVGQVAKTASAGGKGEIAELSDLWASDPDVSEHFG